MQNIINLGLARGSSPGHSGYPKISGQVIRVAKNSGSRNQYPIFTPKNYYPMFGYPIIRVQVRVFPNYPIFSEMANWVPTPWWCANADAGRRAVVSWCGTSAP